MALQRSYSIVIIGRWKSRVHFVENLREQSFSYALLNNYGDGYHTYMIDTIIPVYGKTRYYIKVFGSRPHFPGHGLRYIQSADILIHIGDSTNWIIDEEKIPGVYIHRLVDTHRNAGYDILDNSITTMIESQM